MIKFRNKRRQFSRKLTTRNVYPMTRIGRSLRNPKLGNGNYLNIKCEFIDFLQCSSGNNITTFSQSGFSYLNISNILATTKAWEDHASGFLYFKITKVELAHYRCASETAMENMFGVNQGSLLHHYRLYSSKKDFDMGTAPLASDKVKIFSPYEYGRKVTLPFEKLNGTGLNTPWNNWATVVGSGSIPGQISYNDGNGYNATVTGKPAMVKIIIHVTFKNANEGII